MRSARLVRTSADIGRKFLMRLDGCIAFCLCGDLEAEEIEGPGLGGGRPRQDGRGVGIAEADAVAREVSGVLQEGAEVVDGLSVFGAPAPCGARRETLWLWRQERALRGVFHMTDSGEATWADFAEAIFLEAAARGRRLTRVKHITTTDYPTPAQRPANSRRYNEKLRRVYGLELPEWRSSLTACCARLIP